MTPEEKAKAYDKAYKIAEGIHRFSSNPAEIKRMEEIFPALKESEDEMIIKNIISWLKNIDGQTIPINDYNSALAWLEKQGEQKSTDKIKPKFHEGDWVVYNDNGCICQIKSIREDDYCLWPLDSAVEGYVKIKDIDNKYHLWTIQDAKDGDILVASDGSVFIFKDTIDGACRHYVALTTDGVIKFNERLEHYWETSIAVHPATKEQREQLEKAVADAGCAFDFNKKELKKIEQLTKFEEAVKDLMNDYRDAIGDNDATIEEIKKHSEYLLSLIPQGAAEWSEEDEPQKELAETYLTVFDKKFPILPTLKGKQLADYKNFLNKCQQIFGLKYWGIRPLQAKLFEKLSLLWAAWGAEHLQGLGQTDGDTDSQLPLS